MSTINAADIEAATQVVVQCGNESDQQPAFDLLIAQRRALESLQAAVKATLSLVETEMIRQLEAGAKTVNGVTYAKAPKKSTTWNHELILDRAWKRALTDATQPDGNIDWDLLGQAMREIVTQTYLSPSTKAKAGGLKFLEISASAAQTTVTTGTELKIVGDEQ